jgi:hypothetical protein
MPDSLTHATFAPLVGEVFVVEIGEDAPMPLTLASAVALPGHAARSDPFELKFTGPGPAYLNQMVHRLSHPALGTVEIFLVPVAQEGDRFLYQAIFN